jgi:hypothetical protein
MFLSIDTDSRILRPNYVTSDHLNANTIANTYLLNY